MGAETYATRRSWRPGRAGNSRSGYGMRRDDITQQCRVVRSGIEDLAVLGDASPGKSETATMGMAALGGWIGCGWAMLQSLAAAASPIWVWPPDPG